MSQAVGPAPAADGGPRIVFFDVGDTLVRVEPSWAAVYVRTCREFGLDVQESDLEAAVAAESATGFWEASEPFEATMEASFERVKGYDVRVMAHLGLTDLPDRFYQRVGEHFLAAETWSVFPEVRGVLDLLRAAGVRCSVVSNWVWGLPELLHDLELAHHFEHVVVSSRVGYDKPHPAFFRNALELVGAAATDVLHVGDNLATDVAGARAAGIRAVLVSRPPDIHGHARGDVPPDVSVIADLTGLPPLLGLAPAAPGERPMTVRSGGRS